MPKISVIMPAYNAEKYIAEAIDSILGQTFGDFEFIILNDCSTDRTEEIILSYDDPRIVYLKNKQNMGVAATLNRGLEIAKGEYIARMDADDISMPERFGKQVAYLDAHLNCGICGSAINIFGEGIISRIVGYAVRNRDILADQLFNPAFAHPSVMIRHSTLRKAGGGYDQAFEKAEDYELWYRLLKCGEGYNFSEYLLCYRHHSSQVTALCKPEQQASVTRLRKTILRDMQVDLSSWEMDVFMRLCSGERNFSQEEYMLFVSGGRKIIAATVNYSGSIRKVYANLNIAIILSSNLQRLKFFSVKEPLYLIYKSKWRSV